MADFGRRMDHIGDITWHRPGFTIEQLITMAEIAEIAETPLPTAQSWPRIHTATWPRIVASVTHRGPRPRYYYDPAEVVAWLLEFRPGSRRGVEPARLERLLAEIDDRIEHLQAVRARIQQAMEGATVR